MPRPRFVRDLLEINGYDRQDEERDRHMDRAVGYVVALQEAAGLDEITDGEWRRRSYIGVIADLCHGFERSMRGGLHWTTVIDRISPAHIGAIADEIAFTKSVTARRVKATVPSPYLLGQRMWDEQKSRKAYPTRRSFTDALVPILNQELKAIQAAGADSIQIDDTHLCLFVDQRVRTEFDDPDGEALYAVDLINGVLEGIEGIETSIHLCRRNKGRAGWVGEGGYEPILGALRRLNVERYVMEFTIPVAEDVSVLRELPEDRKIGLGCVDCRGEHIDTPEEIVARVEAALEHVEPWRISLNPDCGFAPGSAAEIPIDEAYLKLRNEAIAAEILRDKYN